MTITHSALSGAECHDPKGIALVVQVTDITVANTIYVAVPKDHINLKEVHIVVDGTLATADEVVTVTDNSDASTMATVTCTAAGSVAGSVFSSTGITGQSLTSGRIIKITNTGASTGARAAKITLYLERS